MKVYIHLALSYLKKQKGRTAALILGVALAVMLVFGFNVISESQSRNQLANIYKMYGTYQGIFINLRKDKLGQIKNDKDVAQSAAAADFGNIVADNGLSMILNSSDKDYIGMNGYKLVKGHLPDSQGELVLEAQALDKMGLKEELGKTIDFKIKKQYIDGKGMKQVHIEKRKFKLVGILDKPKQYYDGIYSLKGFTHFKENEENLIPNNLITYDEIVKLKSNSNLSGKLNQIRERYGIGRLDYEVNSQLIYALNDLASHDTSSFRDKLSRAVVVTAVLLIYNMFNISLIDMIKQIGMLRVIGASKKHTRLIMGFQSLFILIVGIISGLLLGVVFSYFGIRLYSFTSTLLDVSESSIYISSDSICKAIEVGIITVAVSSMIPIWMSGRVSPIEAVRKTDRSKKNHKNGWHHRVGKKLFGLTGEMAYENVWRNKWRTLIIVVSVAMAGYLFIDDIATINNQNLRDKTSTQISNMQENDFKLSFAGNTDSDFVGYTREDVKRMSSIDGVKNVGTKVTLEGFLESDIKDLNDNFVKYNGINGKDVSNTIEVKGYDDKQLKGFQKYVEKGDVSSLNNSSGEYPNAVVFNYYYDILRNHSLEGVRKNLNIGDIITIQIPNTENDNFKYKKCKVRVAALFKPEWIYRGDSTRGRYMEVVLPQEYIMSVSGKNMYDQVSVQSEEGKDIYVYKGINKVLQNKLFPYIESRLSYAEEDRTYALQALKSHMVIVILILFIAGMNVYNTIKNNLLIRINEFSIMRAIGMTVKQLKSMIIREAVLYGVLSSIIAAFLGSYRVYEYYERVNRDYKYAFGVTDMPQFKFPIIPVLLYSGIVIGICILSAYISSREAGKFNIVDGLNVTE